MTERALDDSRRQVQDDQARAADLRSRIQEMTAAATEQASGIAALAERLAEADRLLQQAALERGAVLEELAERHAALAERRAAVASIDRETASLHTSIVADEKRAEAIRDEAARARQKRAALDADAERLTTAAAEADASVAARKERMEGLESRLRQNDGALRSVSTGRSALAQRVAGLEQQHLRLDSRRATLQEMVEARVGLGEAVRAVLARRDAGEGFAGVIAPLADLVEAGADQAALVEIALGTALQSLVVGSITGLPPREELARLAGRVTFLPLQGLGDPHAPPAAAPDPIDPALLASGRVVPLRSVVRERATQAAPAAACAALLDRLLGRTLLVEDLDAALLLAVTAPGARFITRDGTVLEPDGRVLAGPVAQESGEAAGVLQRRSELVALQVELARLDASLTGERALLQTADAQVASLTAEQADLRQRHAAEGRAVVGDQARAEQLRAELSRLARTLAGLDAEAQQLGARLARLDEDSARLRDRAESLRRLHADQAAASADLESQIRDIQARAESRAEQTTVAKVESGRLGEQLGAARREHGRLQLAVEEAERQRRDLERALESSLQRQAEHERVIAEAAAQIDQHATLAAELQDQAQAAAADLHEAARRAAELGERLAAARAHAQHVERDWHSLEVARREVEVKRESVEERAAEELSLDLPFEYPDYRRVMEAGDVARIDAAAASAEVDALKAQIRTLGNVNLEAIDEESQLEQRNEDLIRQVADIDDAAAKLAALIDQLNAASRARFGEVFASIQEHFAGQDGMFRKLFGGGRAEVRLMPLVKEVDGPEGVRKVETDEVDLLESGIEVIAKPPGKEPRSISQLSGGEKTLTAVALLLSIFQSKPSCFCVLDEVDAALDDANVGRYCAVVRQFTTHSHFIVITHNKKTMQAADRLYGITMQERGVSTRVSVKFEQVGRDGTIRAGAPGPEPAPLPEPTEPSSNGHGRARAGVLRRALAGMREDEPESAPAARERASSN